MAYRNRLPRNLQSKACRENRQRILNAARECLDDASPCVAAVIRMVLPDVCVVRNIINLDGATSNAVFADAAAVLRSGLDAQVRKRLNTALEEWRARVALHLANNLQWYSPDNGACFLAACASATAMLAREAGLRLAGPRGNDASSGGRVAVHGLLPEIPAPALAAPDPLTDLINADGSFRDAYSLLVRPLSPLGDPSDFNFEALQLPNFPSHDVAVPPAPPAVANVAPLAAVGFNVVEALQLPDFLCVVPPVHNFDAELDFLHDNGLWDLEL